MKYSLAFLAVLALASASPAHDIKSRSTTLHEDLNDFLALLPTDQIAEIVAEYVNEDKEIEAALEYLTSDSFVTLVQSVDQIPEYIAFLNYMHNAGLEVYTYVNAIHEALGLDKLPVPAGRNVEAARSVSRITGGIASLIADIKAILPTEEISALYDTKLAESPAFAAFVAQIESDEFQTIIDALVANEEYQKLREKALAAGVDVNAIAALLSSIFGIKV
ncbi:protein G12 [Cephus cinctus]|uniref:Protein G12 n=1 Tax=Cephus cinctus TaxID=211228 RepID=A0AAJ7FPN6_CEPCN|nr:protein G12 [Cephus cinctus]